MKGGLMRARLHGRVQNLRRAVYSAKSVGEAERVQVLKRDGKLGEEGPDMIPNAVPQSFTAEEATEFRKELELHP